MVRAKKKVTTKKKSGVKTKSKSGGKTTLYCSFCGKSQHEVRKLIAGPNTFICDECVDVCSTIIVDPSYVYEESGREYFTVVIDFSGSLTDLELATLPGLLKVLNDSFDECNFRLGTIYKTKEGKSVSLEVDSPAESDSIKLRGQINDNG